MHSIAAKYAVRPVARFVHPAPQARTRRLGLRAFRSLTPAPAHLTILRRADLGPIARMRAAWRTIAPAPPPRARAGAPRPSVSIHWAHPGHARADRRSSATPAPWRG